MSARTYFVTILAEDNLGSALQTAISEDFQVSCFRSETESLQHLVKNPCNLLVIEVNHPEFNGFDFCEKVRKVSPNAHIIFVSRQEDVDTVVRCQSFGADYLFFDPIDTAGFQRAVETLYGRRNYWMDLMKQVMKRKKES
jgi:DNA-binding NarL/FixJ family response regulator